jgi:hypothetical protein
MPLVFGKASIKNPPSLAAFLVYSYGVGKGFCSRNDFAAFSEFIAPYGVTAVTY